MMKNYIKIDNIITLHSIENPTVNISFDDLKAMLYEGSVLCIDLQKYCKMAIKVAKWVDFMCFFGEIREVDVLNNTGNDAMDLYVHHVNAKGTTIEDY